MTIQTNDEYNKMSPYWKQVRVFSKGLKDIQKYLHCATNEEENNIAYRKRAKYTNFVGRTKTAFVGEVFRINPIIELPTQIEYMLHNASGSGLSLKHVAKKTVSNVVEIGRHGLLVDYSSKTRNKTEKDAKKNRAKIVQYAAENVPDWSVDEDGNLNYVKLIKGKDKYKKLLLSNGIYTVEEYENDTLTSIFVPTQIDGAPFDFIPFIFVGSVDNSPDVDDVTLWTITDISQGHYQNSADYEELLRRLIPTPYMTIPNAQWMDEMFPDGYVQFGSGAMIPVPEGGSAGILQASENQMLPEAMKDKERSLIAVGAKIIDESANINETATTTRIKAEAGSSVLSNLAENTEAAIVWCLKIATLFMGGDADKIVFILNREFFDTTMNAQDITANIMLLDRGVLAMKDIRSTVRKGKLIEQGRTDEDIDAEVEAIAGGVGF